MGSYGDLKGNYLTLKYKFNEQVAITEDYENRINSLHELDIKHTILLNKTSIFNISHYRCKNGW